MKYDLNRLQSYDFEHLVQSICKKYIGSGCTSFGEGPDGGREATFQGSSPFPSEKENWTGYWVIQAKARTITIEAQGKDHKWLKSEMEKDLNKYVNRKQSVPLPDNLIFFTNIILTSVAKTGGQDKISALCRSLEIIYGIKHIHVISNHDIQDFLDLNRDLAIAYAPFVLPGDVLAKMLELLDNDKERHKHVHGAICRFFETEFMEDIQTKLDQAGKLVTEKVNLEKVFIDLDVSSEKNRYHNFRFVEHIVALGNTIQKWRSNEEINKFVLKAGPGQGKSTLSQFLAQTYRAYFLRDLDESIYPSEPILTFIEDYSSLISRTPEWPRLPFKIILKDYAGWITETHKRDKTESISIQTYLSRLINKKTGMNVNSYEIEILLRNMSSLFIFDGLDEVPVSSNREVVLHELNLFTEMILRKMDADVIIVATTRPQGYSKEFDVTKYNHLNIQDLTEDNCKIYLERLLANTIDNILVRESKLAILERALADSQVSRIMKSPLQASIMAILVNSGGEPPTNKYDLFKQYFTTILNREKQRGISEILQSDSASVTEIHYKLGVYLQAISEKSTNPSASIDITQFDQILTHYLIDKELDEQKIELYTRDIQNAAIDRLVFISQLEDQRIGFAIRSLQEYFAANGYVDNIDDKEVLERIAKISKNAYWSNTLIFITGYIAENKKYLTDNILALCGELNGDGLNPGDQSLTSITKLGSWLALDILNEGIFRNIPKLENRFCKFLEPLFSLASIDKHEEFSMLSENIVNKWVLGFLEKKLEENPNNSTCWLIMSLLYFERKIDTTTLISLMPKDPQTEIEYIIQIADNGRYDKPILELFDSNFLNYSQHTLYDFFSDEDNYGFISAFLAIASVDNIAKVWELLLFATYHSDHTRANYAKLYALIGILLTNEEIESQSFFQRSMRILNIDIVGGYSYDIKGYYPDENIILDRITTFSRSKGSKLSILLCNYLNQQSFENYRLLIQEIDLQEPAYSNDLKSSLSSFDSLGRTILEEKDCEKVFFDHTRKDIFDIISGVENHNSENVVLNYKYVFETAYEGRARYNIMDFYERYKDADVNSIAMLFRNFVSYSVFKMSVSQFEELREDDGFMSFYRGVYKSEEYIQPYYSSYRILDTLFLLPVAEIIDFLNIRRRNERPELEYIVFYDRKQVEPQLLRICLDKCIKVIQLQLLSEKLASYKCLFQTIIYYVNSFDNLAEVSLPFSDMADDENIDRYGMLLMLFDINISSKTIKKLGDYLKNNLDSLKQSDLPQAVRFILRNIPVGPQNESILLMLNSVFIENNFIKTMVLEATKDFVQSQPSLIGINGYNVS
ncbi:NACHT domain-containing protein [Pedobacter miscanthi]|uniref:NACHT domain-containing protein n=1 Tax=Pedobacter miscanthi TaxID=2259170 RepID=A0A366L0X5_9SPHI|nr:NACHT domain-containing protein [Pedobacter miscanthi]RBQ06802.1 hypothetical protein DRW42_13615 [Pedobacter miscanthi]